MRLKAYQLAVCATLAFSAAVAGARPLKKDLRKPSPAPRKALAAPRVKERRETERVAPAHPLSSRTAKQKSVAEPVAPASALHVTHNRKIHLTEATAEQAEAPHKLTSDDFMAPAAVRAGDGLPPATASAAPAVEAQATESRHVAVVRAVESMPKRAAKAVVNAAEDVEKEAAKIPPVIMPALYTRHGKLIVPEAMKGSHEILVHQNVMADQEGLERVQDDDDLERIRASRMLVALPAGAALTVDERLPGNRRYCRPWTAAFLSALAKAHYARFHSPLQVNSAVRTVEFQERLRFSNGNAAPAEGATASPHLTGQAVDLAKHGLSITEIAWMRAYLMPLVQDGKIDVEEEFQQACFHISVYKKYLPQPEPRRLIERHRASGSVLAAAIR